MSISASILIIEDDPAMLAGLKDNLEIEGYRIKTATTVNGFTGQARSYCSRCDAAGR
jgi:DNA-binding response OmpR family regulator